MVPKYCNNCKIFAKKEDDAFCTECGTKLILKKKEVEKKKFCNDCENFSFSNEDIFCTNCGTKLIIKEYNNEIKGKQNTPPQVYTQEYNNSTSSDRNITGKILLVLFILVVIYFIVIS